MKKTYRFSWLLLILVCALAVTSLADSIPSPVPSQHGWNVCAQEADLQLEGRACFCHRPIRLVCRQYIAKERKLCLNQW